MIIRSIFICLITLSFLYAQGTQTVYIAAPNGLSLRSTPSKDSKKLMTIPYGIRIDNCKPIYETNENIDGYPGNWNEVVYEGTKGYIFDGYTLPFPPPSEKAKNVVDYLKSFLGEPICKDSVLKTDNAGLSTQYLETMYFKNQIVYSSAYGYEWNESSISNLDVWINQGYLLVCLMQKYFNNSEILRNSSKPLSINCPRSDISYDGYNIKVPFEIYIDGEIYYVKIMQILGRTTIIWGGAL